MAKLHLLTFGCQMNEHDSLKIASFMRAGGYDLTEDQREADCIILNTCSIREKPEQKVYSALGRLRALKRRNPSLVIGVGGCVAQQEGTRLLERIPHLDFVFGTHQIHEVPGMVRAARVRGGRGCQVSFSEDVVSLHHEPGPGPGGVKAYVPIMQGCNNFCSYCIVPYARGREQSRPAEEILAEASALAAQGVREITLLGQNVNSYGQDREGLPSFPSLLDALEGVEGIWRIRFTTSHPKDLSNELIDAMARLDKVCEHLHLPLQSGSSRLLKAMNRGYSREEYLRKVEALRQRVLGIALSTDVIVGFPGETQEDLEETLSLLEEVRFDGIYSFRFSPRPMTRAWDMADDVPHEVKADRLARVQALQDGITASILDGCVGQVEEILVEGPSPRGKGHVTGRTRTHRIVHAAGEESLVGSLVKVSLVRSLKHSLFGELLERREGL